jgi:hypothetical protein
MGDSEHVEVSADAVRDGSHVTAEYDAARLQRHPVFDRPHRGSCAVVVCHFNPCDYRTTKQNLLRVLDHLDSIGVPVFAAELRCGAASGRPPVLPVDHARVLQLTSSSVLWRKENLWNLVARGLPKRYRNVLCLDADVILTRERLLDAIEDALADSRVVHPFTKAIWLDPSDRPLVERTSFGLAIAHGRQDRANRLKHFVGFGLAARRELWDVCGGLYNCPIGSGDWMFVAALCGRAADLRLWALSPRYWEHYAAWADGVYRWCADSIGYVEGDAFHLWHGSWENRQYEARLARIRGFDPNTDLAPNASSGVTEWTPSAQASKPDLVQAVESYFGVRLEDAPA